jgi:ABC-type phosphate transport system permease subunit
MCPSYNIIQKLVATGVNAGAVITAIYYSIECCVFVEASTYSWLLNGVISEVVDLLSDDPTYTIGPLAATLTLCQSFPKLELRVGWSVEIYLLITKGKYL